MKMHVLSGGRLRMKKSIYFPDADRSEMLELPVSCMLLRHKQGNVLFDTGCHPSIAENPEARWGGLAKFMVPIMPPGEHVLGGLKAVGRAERALRRPAARPDREMVARTALAAAPALATVSLAGVDTDFVSLIGRREADGSVAILSVSAVEGGQLVRATKALHR